jgi:hypothetical protein
MTPERIAGMFKGEENPEVYLVSRGSCSRELLFGILEHNNNH